MVNLLNFVTKILFDSHEIILSINIILFQQVSVKKKSEIFRTAHNSPKTS